MGVGPSPHLEEAAMTRSTKLQSPEERLAAHKAKAQARKATEEDTLRKYAAQERALERARVCARQAALGTRAWDGGGGPGDDAALQDVCMQGRAQVRPSTPASPRTRLASTASLWAGQAPRTCWPASEGPSRVRACSGSPGPEGAARRAGGLACGPRATAQAGARRDRRDASRPDHVRRIRADGWPTSVGGSRTVGGQSCSTASGARPGVGPCDASAQRGARRPVMIRQALVVLRLLGTALDLICSPIALEPCDAAVSRLWARIIRRVSRRK